MRHELVRIDVPGEHEARERAWDVVSAAFAEREPIEPSRTRMLRPAVAIAVVVAALAAVLTSPGRAVLGELREAVGVERAQPALFSLPAPGRLLVASDAGVWVVHEDGSKRLLGPYREASWSPFGRFVVAARENELAALEPDGDVRWTFARRGVRSPRWTGTETDTRIAYVDHSGIRVVAGDGTGDRLLVRGAAGPLAWRPGAGFVLAYSTSRRILVVDTTSGRKLWQARRPAGPTTIVEWSSDGRRLLVASQRTVEVYDSRGTRRYELGVGAAPVSSAALAPSGSSVAFAQQTPTRSAAWAVPRLRPEASRARRLLSGAGEFRNLVWSPDGRWLVLAWPSADQWVLLRPQGSGIRAVANVSEQFRSRSFPRVQGWCCDAGD